MRVVIYCGCGSQGEKGVCSDVCVIFIFIKYVWVLF